MPAAAVAASSTPELPLAEGRLWCELIERRCGLHFPESQWRYLRRRLWERMQLASVATYAQYYEMMASAGASGQWQPLMEDLLNPETSFFRHEPSFAALRGLLNGARGKPAASAGFWSAGCSTGEEAYSLGMMSLALTGTADVVGADLNRGSLGRARAGVFTDRQVASVPALWRARYLREAAGKYEVSGELRSRVSFQPFHLLEPGTYPGREFDVIFCCNVLVYFRRPARLKAIGGLLSRLRRGGHLFLAPGEASGLALPGLTPVRTMGAHVMQRAS
jgi:chemotaxis methyl-accepting protein methylase